MKGSHSYQFHRWLLMVLILLGLCGCGLHLGARPEQEASQLSAAEILKQYEEGGADTDSNAANPSLDESIVRIRSKNRSGSGFFLTRNLIVTNAHVVSGTPSVWISFSQGDEYPAPVAWSDDDLDFAVIQSSIEAPPLPIRDSPLVDGEDVIAVGFPQGRQVIAQSTGTVRQVQECCVVHDALIAGGSSGGPLLDSDSNVVGINTELSKVEGDTKNTYDRAVALKMSYILDALRKVQPGQ